MLLSSINQQLSGTIWRLEIDSLSDTIFLETRTADKQVSFSSINLVNSKINFEDYTSEERWLTGIEASYDGVLLLHNYQSDNTPVHKGLTAIDENAQVLWSNYTYAFDHLSTTGPVVFNTQIQPKKLFLIDVKTGAMLRPFSMDIDTEAENRVQFPQSALPSGVDNLPVSEVHGNIVQSLHYNKFRIVSLHTLTGVQLQQHLYIMDGAALVYEDLLNTDIQKMQPESFILYRNWLVYIKNKAELKVVPL